MTLCWDSDKYYLIAYSAEHNELRHYRVDRMSEVTAADADADDFDKDKFNAARHINRVFGMYGGELIRAQLSFDAALVNVILDYFGKDTVLTPRADGRVEVVADVSVSPVFFGWMFQFGKRAEIKAPDSLIAAMKELIAENSHMYEPVSNEADICEKYSES